MLFPLGAPSLRQYLVIGFAASLGSFGTDAVLLRRGHVAAGWLDNAMEQDATSFKAVKCACNKFNGIVDGRIESATSRIENWDQLIKETEPANQLLQNQIGQHIKEKVNHEANLGSNSDRQSSNAKHLQSQMDTLTDIEDLLKRSLEEVKSSSYEAEALKDILDIVQQRLKGTESEIDTTSSTHADLESSIRKMLEATRQQIQNKEKRLEQGKSVVAIGKGQIVEYTNREEADSKLSEELKSACNNIESEYENRKQCQLNVQVAISEEAARVSSDQALARLTALRQINSTSNFFDRDRKSTLLFSRRSALTDVDQGPRDMCDFTVDHYDRMEKEFEQATNYAEREASDMIEHSKQIKTEITNLKDMLQSSVTTFNIEMDGKAGKVKEQMKKCFDQLIDHAASVTVDEVKVDEKIRESRLKDVSLVTRLRLDKADASVAKNEASSMCT